MNFSESVKQVLLEKIQEMAACPGPFVRNPDSDPRKVKPKAAVSFLYRVA